MSHKFTLTTVTFDSRSTSPGHREVSVESRVLRRKRSVRLGSK